MNSTFYCWDRDTQFYCESQNWHKMETGYQKFMSLFISSSQVGKEDSMTGVKNSNIQEAAAR